ncbi:hypothetical protein FACS1894190_12270 [Spirochaetia bacterium]|nr:hypothetical protein FACS1894190_12270 [Spirochaetia bacterium]
MKRRFQHPLRFLAGIAWVAVLAAGFGLAVMALWNVLLPEMFGLPVITWLQATGLLVLCRVLFGGITGGFRHFGGKGVGYFRARWDAMSEEQRQRFGEEIKKHHGFDPRDFRWFENSAKNNQTQETKDV